LDTKAGVTADFTIPEDDLQAGAGDIEIDQNGKQINLYYIFTNIFLDKPSFEYQLVQTREERRSDKFKRTEHRKTFRVSHNIGQHYEGLEDIEGQIDDFYENAVKSVTLKNPTRDLYSVAIWCKRDDSPFLIYISKSCIIRYKGINFIF